MTPISDVFMLSIDSKLDYALLKKICQTGHSRVPVYEEVDVPIRAVGEGDKALDEKQNSRTQKVKKIIGILLVKQCVLLDPKGLSISRYHGLQILIIPFTRRYSPSQDTAEQSSICSKQRTSFGHTRQVPGRSQSHGYRQSL